MVVFHGNGKIYCSVPAASLESKDNLNGHMRLRSQGTCEHNLIFVDKLMPLEDIC